ncbi:hypothetical protein CRUP_027304, partial [Coryphaenoides rupestris]
MWVLLLLHPLAFHLTASERERAVLPERLASQHRQTDLHPAHRQKLLVTAPPTLLTGGKQTVKA